MTRPFLYIDTADLKREVRQNAKKLVGFGKRYVSAQRRAMTAASKPLVALAKTHAPAVNKQIRKSITWKVWQRNYTIMGMVGQNTRMRKAQQARGGGRRAKGGGISGQGLIAPIHFSSSRISRHAVRAKGSAMRWVPKGARGRGARGVFRKMMSHPGVRERPWLERAGRIGRETALAVYGDVLEGVARTEARKLANLPPTAKGRI